MASHRNTSKKSAKPPPRPDVALLNAENKVARARAIILGIAKGLPPAAQDRVKRLLARDYEIFAENLEREIDDLAPIPDDFPPRSPKRPREGMPIPTATPLSVTIAATMSVPDIVRAILGANPAGLTTAELVEAATKARADLVAQTLYGALTALVKGGVVGRTGRFKNYRYSLLQAPVAPEPEDDDLE